MSSLQTQVDALIKDLAIRWKLSVQSNGGQATGSLTSEHLTITFKGTYKESGKDGGSLDLKFGSGGQGLKVSDLLEIFTFDLLSGYLPGGIPYVGTEEFNVTDFELKLGGLGKTPSVGLRLQVGMADAKDWQIFENPSLTVKDFSVMFLVSQAGSPSNIFLSGGVQGTLHLGVDFNISVYFTSAAKSWRLVGEAYPKGVTIGTFVAELAEKFGLPAVPNKSLPEDLNAVEIDRIAMSYDSGSHSFSFSCEGDYGESTWLTIDVHLLSQLNGTKAKRNYKIDFDGRLTFNKGKPDELDFEIDLAAKDKNTDFVATMQSKALTKSVSIASLLKAFTKQSFPDIASLEIDLKDVMLGHISGAPGTSVFALDMAGGINFSALGDIPVLGKDLSALETLKIAFRFIYPTAELAVKDIKGLNAIVPSPSLKLRDDKPMTAKELLFRVDLQIGGENITVGRWAGPRGCPIPATSRHSSVPADSRAGALPNRRGPSGSRYCNRR